MAKKKTDPENTQPLVPDEPEQELLPAPDKSEESITPEELNPTAGQSAVSEDSTKPPVIDLPDAAPEDILPADDEIPSMAAPENEIQPAAATEEKQQPETDAGGTPPPVQAEDTLPIPEDFPSDLPDEPRQALETQTLRSEPAENTAPPPRPRSERQSFYELDFNELDRDLSDEEQQEWNSIYASYRGRSVMTGTVIGVDRHRISVKNAQTGMSEQKEMYCAIVVPYRVRIVIPSSEIWENGQERPAFVLRNMVGASFDFVIIRVDREAGFAIASRKLAARSRRYFFAHRPALHAPMSRLKCRILSVGPRRCLVECYGHDIDLTQRDIRYTAIPDLRAEYHPGDELDCVVKAYDPVEDKLRISVKETKSNPFEGAELRHPTGSRRQAVIAGKYGGGVFCNLPDGTVCMCAYSFQYEDSQFQVGDTVIVVIQRFDLPKKQIYGKIISKWR